jgi:hypothetical protein
MMNRGCIAFVFGTQPGIGGLGLQVRSALDGLTSAWSQVVAIGPLPTGPGDGDRIVPVPARPALPGWLTRYSPLRWWIGLRQQIEDGRLGRWAAARVAESKPAGCYVFTQVGLETLRWARDAGVPSVLDSPNGHLRNFRDVYCSQSRQWCDRRYLGHPTEAMVARVEEEYRLADRIRVSSAWARESLVAGGVPSGKIDVVPQPLDLDRYRPMPRPAPAGPLRIVFVGSMDLRKGFVYLRRRDGRPRLPAATGTRGPGAGGRGRARRSAACVPVGGPACPAVTGGRLRLRRRRGNGLRSAGDRDRCVRLGRAGRARRYRLDRPGQRWCRSRRRSRRDAAVPR